MGARICALAMADRAFALVGAVDHASSPALGRPAGEGGPKITSAQALGEPKPAARVVIDFSSEQGAQGALVIAQRFGAALVVGTTALGEQTLNMLKQAASKTAVLVSPNTSLGVAVAADLAKRAAGALGPEYECSIIEAHHSAKKDAPSGTALRLAGAVGAAGREVRPDQIVSIRGGDVVGEHTVRFAGRGEYIEITHRATSRDLFALGALRAAAWIASRRPGWYSMEEVLAERSGG